MKNVMIVSLMLLSEIARSQVSDPNLPHIKSIDAECNSKVLVVVVSKGIRCGTLSIDGSEFTITPLFGSISTTSANSCVFGTEIDTVWITMSDPQPAGDYKLTIKKGSDDNTLVDLEGNEIPDGESFDFTVFPPIPTPMDSLAPFDCGPHILHLIFPDLISCNSISPDGSDFQISGTTNAHIIKAEGSCDNQFTRVIHVTLDSPLVKAGNYQITLVRGSDLNALINHCGTETPPGASLSFQTLDTVSALFSYDITYSCTKDTILLHYFPAGAISWQWMMDSSFTSNSLNPFIIENKFGPRYIQHIVSNGSCSDTVTEVVNLDNSLKAAFLAPTEICPKDLVTFQNTSIGDIESWYWNFGDGSSSSLETPEGHRFPDSGNDATYRVILIVQNNLNCSDTSVTLIKKMQSCYITVPNAFTPNGDGKNDYLYPLNAFNAIALDFRVYNRLGQIVFETRDWTKKWDGNINGHPQTTGTYVWILTYTDGLSGKKISQQGTTVLIR